MSSESIYATCFTVYMYKTTYKIYFADTISVIRKSHSL